MRENTDQKNSVFGHFSRSAADCWWKDLYFRYMQEYWQRLWGEYLRIRSVLEKSPKHCVKSVQIRSFFFFRPYFHAFSPKMEKNWPEKTPYSDILHVVKNWKNWLKMTKFEVWKIAISYWHLTVIESCNSPENY